MKTKENEMMIENVEDVREETSAAVVPVDDGDKFNTGYEFEVDEDPADDGETRLAVDTSRVIAELPFYRRIVKNIRTKNGKPLFNHFAYTREVIGKTTHEIFAYFDPSDAGGYGLFEIIFAVCKTAKLVVTEHCVSDTKGGTRTYFSYEIFSTNAEGTIYSCPVRLHGKSDKAYLDIVIKNENKLTE